MCVDLRPLCSQGCKDAQAEDWIPESAHEFISHMAASTATCKEWNAAAMLTEAVHSFRGRVHIGPTHSEPVCFVLGFLQLMWRWLQMNAYTCIVGLTGSGKSPIYNRILKGCMALEAKLGGRFVIQVVWVVLGLLFCPIDNAVCI